MKLTTLIFDINETLLDLAPLKNKIKIVLNDREDLIPLWFSTLLHYSLVANATSSYADFSEIGVNTLLMIAHSNDIDLSRSTAEETIIKPFQELLPYKDVQRGLERLRDKGYKMVALTNSSQDALQNKLKFAGIYHLFDHVLSIAPVKKFKPDAAAYNYALDQVDSEASETMMIAAHAWDVMGAQAAGLQTCFVQRPGKVQYPKTITANLTVKNLEELADILI